MSPFAATVIAVGLNADGLGFLDFDGGGFGFLGCSSFRCGLGFDFRYLRLLGLRLFGASCESKKAEDRY
ncbi:MAG: hypothetical protein WD342_02055 [Verrucomicrobiales bacterium]